MKTTFHIPDLMPLYNEVKDAVLNAQGSDGFIVTDDASNDIMYAMVFNNYESTYEEYPIKALRVSKDSLECIYDSIHVVWDRQSVSSAKDEEWASVLYDDFLFFLPTIFSIAENLSEYISND